MQRADAALLEGEFDHHQFVRVQDDAAAVAVGRRRPGFRVGLREKCRVGHVKHSYLASQPPSTGTTAPCM